jgi:hypothetical protein
MFKCISDVFGALFWVGKINVVKYKCEQCAKLTFSRMVVIDKTPDQSVAHALCRQSMTRGRSKTFQFWSCTHSAIIDKIPQRQWHVCYAAEHNMLCGNRRLLKPKYWQKLYKYKVGTEPCAN